MNIQLIVRYVLLLLLFVTFAMAEKQIQLEDIERDNLLSERRVNRDQGIGKNGQSQQFQRLSVPIRVGPQYEVKLNEYSFKCKMAWLINTNY